MFCKGMGHFYTYLLYLYINMYNTYKYIFIYLNIRVCMRMQELFTVYFYVKMGTKWKGNPETSPQ